MKELKLAFRIDQENHKIFIEKEFAAPLDIVWSVWTREKALDKWWAPKPWRAQTKNMNFRENGKWFYAMQGPEGEEHFSKITYEEVLQEQRLVFKDFFCDENEKPLEEFGKSRWTVDFEAEGSHTLVEIEIIYESVEEMEKMLNMRFQEGFTTSLLQLDEYLRLA